jgi:cytochrome c553
MFTTNSLKFKIKRILSLLIIVPTCAISTNNNILNNESGEAEAPPRITNELTKALALTPNIENGEKIYPLCAACHMKTGWGKKDGSFPDIAGQHPNVLIKQLEDIAHKHRDNPTMYPFTDPDEIGGLQGIRDVTAYIAALPPTPEPGVGSGEALELGEKLYKEHCVSW